MTIAVIVGFLGFLVALTSLHNKSVETSSKKSHTKRAETVGKEIEEVVKQHNLNPTEAAEFRRRRMNRAETIDKSIAEARQTAIRATAKTRAREMVEDSKYKQTPAYKTKKMIKDYKEKTQSTGYFNGG